MKPPLASRSQIFRYTRRACLLAPLLVSWACSNADSNGPNEAGGSAGASVGSGGGPPATGGSAGAGLVTGTSGSTGTGGSASPAGGAGTGGATTSGGATGTTGGATATGGMTTSGGATGTGGATATGGAMASGGAMAAGGATATGGMTGGTPDQSVGCGKAPPSNDASVMVGSGTGSYILDLPTNYDNTKSYPLIFVWHGHGVTNTSFHEYLNMHKEVGNDGIVVTPECVDNGDSWPNDASYFDALYDHFTTNYCIDESRVFTTGHSMGGMHTGLLGCLRADKLRADAVLAAPHPNGQCVEGNMAAMMSVGTSDSIADGPTEFQWWADKNGCTFSMTTPVDPADFTTGTPAEGGTCVEYGGCDAGKPVRTCTFDGGHEIPNWVQGAVWSFFKKL